MATVSHTQAYDNGVLCSIPPRVCQVHRFPGASNDTHHVPVLYWLDMGPTGKTENEVSGLLRASETVPGRLSRSCMRSEEAMRGVRDVCPGEVRWCEVREGRGLRKVRSSRLGLTSCFNDLD
jgi:hypothetical protein